MHISVVYASAVLSICPFVTLVYCVKKAKGIGLVFLDRRFPGPRTEQCNFSYPNKFSFSFYLVLHS